MMSGYLAGTDYAAYLQARASVDEIRWDLSQAHLDLVASRETIEKLGFRIEPSVSAEPEPSDDARAEGFVTLHYDVSSLERLIGDSPAKFDWGLGRLEAAIGGLQAPLDVLLRLARTPDQTWAYAQFGLARDAFQHDRFPQALAHIKRAINGDQAHAGHRLEYRFHHFLGIIHRGCYRNNAPEIVDLEKAKQAYLEVPRYAGEDHKYDAARALCAAGWASYCQNRLDQALEYTNRALTYSDLAEANFQRGKILLHLGEVSPGLESLSKAIDADPLYAVRCFDDGDFLAHEHAVRDLVVERRDERVKRGREIFAAAERMTRIVELEIARADKLYSEFEKRLAGENARKLKRLREEIAAVALEVQSATGVCHRNANMPDNAPLIDVTSSIKEARRIADPVARLSRAIEAHSDRLYDFMANEVENEYQRAHARVSARGPFPVRYAIWPVYGISVIAAAWVMDSTRSGGAILLFSGVMIGGAIVAAVTQVVLGEAAAKAHRNKAIRIAKEAAALLRTKLLSLHRQMADARERIQARYEQLRDHLDKKSNAEKR